MLLAVKFVKFLRFTINIVNKLYFNISRKLRPVLSNKKLVIWFKIKFVYIGVFFSIKM